MRREDIIKLENHLQILLNSYQNLKDRMTEMSTELQSKEAKLASNRSMINDLKEQLDKLNTGNSTSKETQQEINAIQAKVLALVNEVDNCIKSIE